MFDEVLEWPHYVLGTSAKEYVIRSEHPTVEDVLDPIIKEVDSLRIFNADFQQQSLSIDRTLADANARVQRQ